MDALQNPFSPGAGSPPPELVGREDVMQEAVTLLGRVKRGKSEKSLLMTGLRGVGKTVLLNEIERTAIAEGYHTISFEATEDKALGSLLVSPLKMLLFDLNRIAGAGEKVKRGLAVLRSFIGTLKVTANDITFGLDINPEQGSADSGDLEFDLSQLFIAVGEAALDRKTAIAIFIDELQYLSQKEIGALIMAMHKMQQNQLPLVLIGAGLPTLLALVGNAKSYAERLFNYPAIGVLSETDASRALQDPTQSVGVSFTASALHEVFRQTQGYPYFIQEWGYQAWNVASRSPIALEVIQSVTEIATARLDQNFFRVRYDRLTPSEKRFLRAMAEVVPNAHRISDVAEMLNVKVTSIGPMRASLIKKGMIYSPAYGEIAFTVPLFDEFMKRAIPAFAP